MAVYTQLEMAEISAFLNQYALGTLTGYEGIVQGVENTNYKVDTNQAPLILTVFEKRADPAQLPLIFSMIDACRHAGLPCPMIYGDKQGKRVGQLHDKMASLQEFMPGEWRDQHECDESHVTQIGDALARMHGVVGVKPLNESRNGKVQWRQLIEATGADFLDQYHDQLYRDVMEFLDVLDKQWPAHLPHGNIHADLFPDNVFFDHGQLSAIIDFYFAHYGLFIYDYAVTTLCWCVSNDGVFNPDLYAAYSHAYEKIRPLSDEEKAFLPMMLKAASVRFIATRGYDWTHTPAEASIVKKDPAEYITKFLNCEEWL